jgi:hypothetical protein
MPHATTSASVRWLIFMVAVVGGVFLGVAVDFVAHHLGLTSCLVLVAYAFTREHQPMMYISDELNLRHRGQLAGSIANVWIPTVMTIALVAGVVITFQVNSIAPFTRTLLIVYVADRFGAWLIRRASGWRRARTVARRQAPEELPVIDAAVGLDSQARWSRRYRRR